MSERVCEFFRLVVNSITTIPSTNKRHPKMMMNHKHDSSCRFAFKKRGVGSVEVTLLVIAGFIACVWGFNDVKKGSGEIATDVRLRQIAAEMVKVSESAKISGIDLVDDHIAWLEIDYFVWPGANWHQIERRIVGLGARKSFNEVFR